MYIYTYIYIYIYILHNEYVRVDDFKVTAPSSFGGGGAGELAFEKGDRLVVRPAAAFGPAWWLAKLGSRRGFVPRYLLDPEWREVGKRAARLIWSRYSFSKGRSHRMEEESLGVQAKVWLNLREPPRPMRPKHALSSQG